MLEKEYWGGRCEAYHDATDDIADGELITLEYLDIKTDFILSPRHLQE